MKVWFGQIYTDPGATFPFSHVFQQRLSEAVSSRVQASDLYMDRFGADFELMFRISAKSELESNEVLGPTVYRKTRDVEYTIFLPFSVVMRHNDAPRQAVVFILNGVFAVFESLQISTSPLAESSDEIIESLCADPEMLHPASWNQEENNTHVRRVFEAFFAQKS